MDWSMIYSPVRSRHQLFSPASITEALALAEIKLFFHLSFIAVCVNSFSRIPIRSMENKRLCSCFAVDTWATMYGDLLPHPIAMTNDKTVVYDDSTSDMVPLALLPPVSHGNTVQMTDTFYCFSRLRFRALLHGSRIKMTADNLWLSASDICAIKL